MFNGFCQQTPLETVNKLFLAMETNNGKLAGGLFTRSAQLHTVLEDSMGNGILKTVPASRLIEAFGSEKDDLWQEPIWNEKVNIDGKLASVWVDYGFYRNGKLSHCGVDAFHLILQENKWKIFHLVDTRKQNCDIPNSIKKQYDK